MSKKPYYQGSHDSNTSISQRSPPVAVHWPQEKGGISWALAVTMMGFLGWLGPSLSTALPELVGWEPPDLCSPVSPGKRVQTRKILIFQLLTPDADFSPWLFMMHPVRRSQVHRHPGVPGASQASFSCRFLRQRLLADPGCLFLKAVASSPSPRDHDSLWGCLMRKTLCVCSETAAGSQQNAKMQRVPPPR